MGQARKRGTYEQRKRGAEARRATLRSQMEEALALSQSLTSPEEKEKQKRLGGIVAEFRGAQFDVRNRTLLQDFTYNFRQRDRIGIVGPNG